MALPATLDWEVRADGNAANGGAFVRSGLGIDLSQQASPEATYTDLVIGSAGNENKLSSVLRPFVSNDRDNVLNVTSGVGFTTGRYRILSVDGSGVATMDRNVGTAGSTGGNGRLGGALATLAGALAAMVGSNHIYVRGTGHTAASAITGGSSGTGDAPSQIIGYGTSRTDNVQAVIQASASFTSLLNMSGDNWVVRNLELDCNNSVERALFPATTGVDIYVENCWLRRWTRCGFRSNTSNEFRVVNCHASGGTGGSNFGSEGCAGFVGTGFGIFERCSTWGSQSNGFCADNGAPTLVNCIAWGLTQDGGVGGHGVYIFGSTGFRCINCTFASLEGSGLANPNASVTAMTGTIVENCLFADIDRYAFESTTVNYGTNSNLGQSIRNNAFYSVTLGKQFQVPAGQNEITLTVDPFVDLAGGDLALNNATNGGALARGAGVPGTTISDLGTGSIDIGALQASSGGDDHDEMMSLFREWTSEFSATRLPNSVVNRYLQSGLVELNRILGYSYADDTVTLTAGTQEYSQPDGTVEIVFIEHNGKRLEKADLEQLEQDEAEWRSLPASTPKQWAHYGSKLVLIPEPDAAAVAAASTITVRFLRSPRDIATFGPEGLVGADWRTAVRWAVREFSAAHPDSATALTRRQDFEATFLEAARGAMEYYQRRRLARGAPSELQAASGQKRSKV